MQDEGCRIGCRRLTVLGARPLKGCMRLRVEPSLRPCRTLPLEPFPPEAGPSRTRSSHHQHPHTHTGSVGFWVLTCNLLLIAHGNILHRVLNLRSRANMAQDSQVHILALAFREKVLNSFKVFPLRSEAVRPLVGAQKYSTT